MKQKQLVPFILLSLLFHLLLILFVRFLKIPVFESGPKLAEPIWIDLKNNKYEIADIEKPSREEKPDETKFLGMYDMKTAEETVAPTPEKRTKDQRLETRDQQPKKERSLHGSLSEKSIVHRPRNTAGGQASSIVPPQESLPEDFFPDFRKGPHTYLNVLRFPDIQYFVRLKRVFRMTFDPVSPLREAYFQNRIARGEVETVLGVSVDRQGQLAEVFVFRGSGIEDFDQEALRTIRASAPFSVPPEKLLDKDGLLHMSWTFTVYL